MRCDEAGKLIVRWSFRRRMIAFFMSNQKPVGKRYYYVQCMRFNGRMNQTLATFAEIKALSVGAAMLGRPCTLKRRSRSAT